MISDNFQEQRQRMVQEQLRARGIKDERVLKAMATVPREEFVPKEMKEAAYADTALSIGQHQTISQPYVVARMCELLELKKKTRILDIGTGSGYQAAILSLLASQVYSLEIIETLAIKAKKTLKKLGYDNVKVIVKDGRKGLPGEVPFEAIISAAVSRDIPPAWKEQLKIGGKIVAPVAKSGFWDQRITRITKRKNAFQRESFEEVVFVPLVK